MELTKGFYMGVYAVTQEEYETVMGKNPSCFSAQGEGKEKVAGMDTRRFPVEMVSWEDAKEFCRKLSAKEGRTYRLPTEAEWEYSCRAGTTTPFHFGETISTDQANYNGNFTYGNGKKGVYREKTTPVGSFPANAWGLHDMHGNVYQWCQDWRGDNPQKDVIDPQGPDAGTVRVMRGGSWLSIGETTHFGSPGSCRSAQRQGENPRASYQFFGFRVCFYLD